MKSLINRFFGHRGFTESGRGEHERDGGLGVHFVVDDSTAKLLDAVPSETSPDERRFLYAFFSAIWSGWGDVIEIGPFLGGTSRAIALGMSANPRVADAARLLTYDRFRSYYTTEDLSVFLRPLIESGVLRHGDLNLLGDSVQFLEIFEKIHSRYDYYRRIVPIDQAVPDRPADLNAGKGYLHIPDGVATDAVFVDGCKSWFGTKYFMKEVCSKCRPGANLIFHDYGWHTCFWIPALIALLDGYFRMIAYVDTTYVFVLNRPLKPDAVERLYPDAPVDVGERRMDDLFDELIEAAVARRDRFAVVRHTLQKAGALSYLGHTDRARQIIARLSRQRWVVGHEEVIAAAARSPTYTPEGRIYL